MENKTNTSLVKLLLPSGITEYFSVMSVKVVGETLYISLDENNIVPKERQDKRIESKGFYPVSRIEDFPIREHKVYLNVRRRKWKDLDTGRVFSRDWNLTAKGTSYTKEFGAFLKEID